MQRFTHLAIAACVLGAHALLAPVAFAACPAGCSCWTEDGVSKMACSSGSPAQATSASADAATDAVAAAPGGSDAPAVAGVEDPDERWLTDEEKLARLQERQRQLDRQLLEVQRSRFEARARGDAPEEVERLEKAFADIQGQRRATLRQIKASEAN